MKKHLSLLFAALAFSLSVHAAAPTCGLTIITHGFQSENLGPDGALPQWVRSMAQAITNQSGSSIPIYRVRYDKRGTLTPADDQIILQDGASSIDISGGAIILLDWVGISNEPLIYPTEGVASGFFDYLFSTNHNGHFLFEVPIHFIGHSRGASLNSALVYALAYHGILVDHVTTLDPHPSTSSTANDWGITTYINTLFADNYWRHGVLPQGDPVVGAFDVNLDHEFDGLGDPQGFFVTEHQAVHAYYYGTVNTTASDDGDGCSVLTYPWFTLEGISRDITGFAFSRYARRINRDSAGVNQFISGAGGTGSRVSVDSPQQLWSNAGFDQRSVVPSVVVVGQAINIPYYFADRNAQQTISFYTDADTNPFNGQRSQIGSENQNSRPAGSIGTATFQWTPTAADVGTHFIRVKGANPSGYARYDYFFKPITVQAALTPIPTITSVSPATLPPSSSPQLITINGANFKLPGDPNASSLVFYDPANNPYPRTPINVTTTTMQYNIIVQSATGTWKVKVVNGGTESLLYSFTVGSGTAQLAGLSINGPSTINENTSGQLTATANFTDGSSQTVTSSSTWSDNSSATTISSSGLLNAGSVGANTLVTVTAVYTTGGITKTTTANVTVVDASGGGGFQLQSLIANSNFASGSSGWTLTGAFQADSRFPTCRSCPGYAYLANNDGSPGNNLSGTMAYTFTIPANAVEVALDYWHRTTTTEAGGNFIDRLNVRLRLSNGSLVGLDDLWNSNANATYAQRSINLIAYKGQTVTLEFAGTTDVSGPTTFRIDDVTVLATVPIGPTQVLLGLGGPSSVQEGTTAQYDAIVVYSDGTVQSVTPTWSENSSATTISSSGVLSAGSVGGDTPVTVSATYPLGGVSTTVSKDVTIVNVAPTFSSLAISGPSSMNENSSGQFTATAIYSDGSTVPVSPTWTVASGPGNISNSGSLTMGELSNDATTTVSASLMIDGVTRNASQQVTVINVPTPPTLVSLSISGPSSLNENSTAQYTATASFSDGSSQGVNPTWLDDSSATSISIFGLLSAGDVASDTPMTVSASYSIGVVTQNATKSVTVVNGTVTPTYTLTVSASNGTVAKNPDQATYASGSQVVLTAVPANGYQFNNWSGNASGSVNPLPVTMDGNKSMTANFIVAQPTKQLMGVNLSNGVFTFTLNGAVGSTFVISTSPDLVNWTAIATNTIPVGGSVVVSAPLVPTQSTRFYRAVSTRLSFLDFEIRDLGTAGEESGAEAVNDLGQVVGWTSPDGIPRAFLWAGGVLTRLSQNYSAAADINLSGQIVGQASVNANDRNLDRAVLWTNGISTVLYNAQSRLSGVNDSGWIVGRTDTRPFKPLLFRNGGVTELPAPPGNHSSANKINSQNLIVGSSGGPNGGDCYIWTDPATNPQQIAPNGGCLGVNDQGEVVGESDGKAFRWKAGKLDLLEAGGATSINNAGWIVGWRTLNNNQRAFLFKDDNLNGVIDSSEIRDLNELLPPGSGWVLSRASDVNNHGTIVGIGTLNGQTRAFGLFAVQPP